MRSGRSKLHDDREAGRPPALYDLAADVGETHDLAGERSDRVRSMPAALDEWEAAMVAPRWGPHRGR